MINKQKREEILKKYELLYSDYFDINSREPIRRGFEFNDGWLNLIDKLSALLQSRVDEQKKKDPAYNQCKIVQCKEKFGALRVYVHGSHDEFIDGAISMAEKTSLTICEFCGNAGSLKKSVWLRVTCDLCEDKRKESVNNV